MNRGDPDNTSPSELASPSEELVSILDRIESSPDPTVAIARLLVDTATKANPGIAEAIRYCAVPRRLDARIVGALRGSDDQAANRRILQVLIGTGLLQSREDGGYVYHDNVRDGLIDQWRTDAPDRFRELNDRMVRLYDEDRDAALRVARAWDQAADVVKEAGEERFTQLSGEIEGLALAPTIEALYHRWLAAPEAAFKALQRDLQAYEGLGRFQLCEALLSAASDLFLRPGQEGGQDARERWLRYWRARLAMAGDRRAEAERILRELLQEIDAPAPVAGAAGADLRLRLWALDLLAHLLTESGRYPEALRVYRQVLKLKENTGEDPRNLPVAYHNVAELHRRLGEYDEAETQFRAAIASAEREGHNEMMVWTRLALSTMLSESGDSDQAWEVALEATVRARTTDALAVPDVQREVAMTILGLGHSGEPWLMDTVRAEFRGMLGALGSSLLLLRLESTYFEQLTRSGQLERAERALSDLVVLAQIASTERRGQIALQIGRLAENRGGLDAAHEQYGEALDLARSEQGADVLEVHALLHRGRVSARRGRWLPATQDLRHSARRASTLGLRALSLAARLELASLQRRRGDLEGAAELARRVEPAIEGTRSSLRPLWYRVRGDICRSAGELEEAAEHYGRAHDSFLAFDRPHDAACAAAAAAEMDAQLGRWSQAAECTGEVSRLTGQLAAVAAYRPSPEVEAADRDNADGLDHLFASGGTSEGEIRTACDRFHSAVERLPGAGSQAAWYRLNLAFAHHLLREQREAVEALEAVLATQEGWARSEALHRLFAEWGAEHGRTLLREGDPKRAEQRFKSTTDTVRGSVQSDAVLGLACGHADAMVALGRDDEAHAELQSVLEQAAVRDDARTQVAARLRLALVASTPLHRRIEHVQHCLELRFATAGANGPDRVIAAIDELVALQLPEEAYRRLREALSLTAASVGDPAERGLLGRSAATLAARTGWSDGSPRQAAGIALALNSALGGAAADGAVAQRFAEAVERGAGAMGLPLPAVTLRLDPELAPAAYAIEVRQSVAARGRVRPGPGSSNAFDDLVRQLEAVVRQHAAAFLEVDWVAGQLADVRKASETRLPPALDGPDGEVLLWEVLRRLLEEGVPITDVGSIVAAYGGTEPHPADVQPVVERVRLARAACLPAAAGGSRDVVGLPRRFEAVLARHVRQAGGRTFLAMPPASSRMQRDVLLGLLADREPGTAALRVRNRSLRPFVRRFAERVVPDLPVLSEAELDRARPSAPGTEADAGW